MNKELRVVTEALKPPRTSFEDLPSPVTPSPRTADSPFTVPIGLLRLPWLRDAARSAADKGKAALVSQLDFDAVNRYGLSLQELAAKLSERPADALDLLQRACDVYGRAAAIRPGHPQLLYNWGVALSDIAQIVRPQQPDEAAGCLLAAAGKYELAIKGDPRNTQALNNWALILSDVAPLRPPTERPGLVKASIARFRRAIRLQPTFDRAIYNLGTILYSQSCSLQAELLGRGSSLAGDLSQNERTVRTAFAHAAQYIAIAYCLRPDRDVYAESLAAIQRLLPLPYLRMGPLMAAAAIGTADKEYGIGEVWCKTWLALDFRGLRSVRAPAGEEASQGAEIAILSSEIIDARVCNDPSLPEGHQVWIGTKSRKQMGGGIYFIASTAEAAEGWVDALHLVKELLKGNGGVVLQEVLGGGGG